MINYTISYKITENNKKTQQKCESSKFNKNLIITKHKIFLFYQLS